MKPIIRKTVHLILVLATLLSLGTAALATDFVAIEAGISDTAAYLCKTVPHPQVGSVGGEWAVLGLARSGYRVPDSYYQSYYTTVEAYVAACNGKLHDKKYTEYSRLIVALTAIGKDARQVAGFDLTKALGDYDKTIWQGLNGPIWALIALDSGNYPMPQNAEATTQATRQMYVDRILACQLSDGGWSLNSTPATFGEEGTSDPDITGIALQALANYQDQSKVKTATEQALSCLSKQQDADGGYSSWGTSNSESVVQVLVGLTELGIKLDDSRFVKNGKTVLDNLISYYTKGSGFQHTSRGSGSNQMATEQGLYGLVAAQRAQSGKSSLYRMTDALQLSATTDTTEKGVGLPGKQEAVTPISITAPGKTFEDIASSANTAAIEALASREIIDGKSAGRFEPDSSMTRAEFAKIIVAALGLTPKTSSPFTDVTPNDWFAPFVGTAYRYGIVTGTTATTYTPNGTITRQEAAVMVARAAKLCGMDTNLQDGAVRDMLAQFGDYTKSAAWARTALAFCYQETILNQADLLIAPTAPITRGEIAQMLFHLLGRANLL